MISWTILQTFSMVYELFEWGLTLVMTANVAENYNGQQGEIKDAHKDMVNQYNNFLENDEFRQEVIAKSFEKLVFSEDRISSYFDDEVSNFLDDDGVKGLELFLSEVCGLEEGPTWLNLD